MKKETVVKIITEIKANYRYTYRDMTADEIRVMTARWYDCLKPFSDAQVEDAFRVALCKLSVPPTLADIIGIISRRERLKEKKDSELWTMFRNAIEKAKEATWDGEIGFCGHYELKDGHAVKAYSALDEIIRAYIDFDGFCEICKMNDEALLYERTRFLKALPELREAFSERKLMQKTAPQIGTNGIAQITGGN